LFCSLRRRFVHGEITISSSQSEYGAATYAIDGTKLTISNSNIDDASVLADGEYFKKAN
jgi:hypothetical protein